MSFLPLIKPCISRKLEIQLYSGLWRLSGGRRLGEDMEDQTGGNSS